MQVTVPYAVTSHIKHTHKLITPPGLIPIYESYIALLEHNPRLKSQVFITVSPHCWVPLLHVGAVAADGKHVIYVGDDIEEEIRAISAWTARGATKRAALMMFVIRAGFTGADRSWCSTGAIISGSSEWRRQLQNPQQTAACWILVSVMMPIDGCGFSDCRETFSLYLTVSHPLIERCFLMPGFLP